MKVAILAFQSTQVTVLFIAPGTSSIMYIHDDKNNYVPAYLTRFFYERWLLVENSRCYKLFYRMTEER